MSLRDAGAERKISRLDSELPLRQTRRACGARERAVSLAEAGRATRCRVGRQTTRLPKALAEFRQAS